MSVKNWTINNIEDLGGKVYIVTGANSGLGFESSKALAAKGASVVMACRNLDKGNKAKEEILKDFPAVDIKVMKLDLQDLSSVKSFSESFQNEYQRLDVLLNNAGIMMPPYQLTKDGYESQFGVNHLGHFALTGLLMNLIKTTPNSRVVNVSSLAHKRGEINFDNLMYEKENSYSPMKAYGRSKIANLYFTYELQRRFEANKINALSVSAHPGISETNLSKFMEKRFIVSLLKPIFSFIMQPASMGALPQLRAATDPSVKGAQYYGPGSKREFKGYPVLVNSNESSHDLEIASRLWRVSEELTKVVYDFS